MPVSMEMQVRMAELRNKARDGVLTLEETKEAILFLRGERMAMEPLKPASKKAAAAAVDTDSLLGELGI